MKAVLDTNVLVSGMINPAGAPGRIVDLVRAGSLQLVADDRVLAECAEVLSRPVLKACFTATDMEAILAFLYQGSEMVLPTILVAGLPDPDDAAFLEVALSAGVPLVTGNKRHFPADHRHGCLVLSPAEFLVRCCGA